MKYHVIRDGHYYVTDRLKRSDVEVPERPTPDHQWDGSTWNKVVQPKEETEIEVIQQAAKFILDNLVVPVEKQTERDQLKTKLNTKRSLGS